MLAPATLAALQSTRAIETRSLPTSLAATHRGLAFYVAFPESSIPDLWPRKPAARGLSAVTSDEHSNPNSLCDKTAVVAS